MHSYLAARCLFLGLSMSEKNVAASPAAMIFVCFPSLFSLSVPALCQHEVLCGMNSALNIVFLLG